MKSILASRSVRSRGGLAPKGCYLVSVALLFLFTLGCHSVPLVDAKPLDSAGMSYDSIQTVKSLHVTAAEVSELAKARLAGLSDDGCISMLRIFHARNRPFDAGNAVTALIQVNVSEPTILELARLNQLGVEAGEFQAMRLAGISDATILEVARRRAAGKSALDGASLANMKNAGILDSTLQELVRRGVPDSQLNSILAMRRHGERDAAILKHFSGS